MPRALDQWLRAERFQEVRLRSARRPGESGIPVRQQLLQHFPQRRELIDPAIQLLESDADELTDTSTRRPTAVPRREHALQILDREADDERALDQQHALDGRRRIPPIA